MTRLRANVGWRQAAALTALLLAPPLAAAPERPRSGQFVLEHHTYPVWVDHWAWIRSRGAVWMATPGGLVRFHLATRAFLPTLTTTSGLPDNALSRVAELGERGGARRHSGPWHVLDPKSMRFAASTAEPEGRPTRQGEWHVGPTRGVPTLRRDPALGIVTFDDGRWTAGAVVGKVEAGLKHAYGMGGRYMREAGTTLWVSAARDGLRPVKKRASGDFERVRHVLGVGPRAALVLTSQRTGPWDWTERLYRADAGGWSEPLLAARLKGFLAAGRDIWLVEARPTVHHVSRDRPRRVDTYRLPRGLLRSAWIADMARTPLGLFLANCGSNDAPWQGGLTLYRPAKGTFAHYRGKLAIHRPYRRPADYRPNVPLPCNYVSQLAWDGTRLWVVAGGQGRAEAAAAYTPYLGLFSFDGTTWRDWHVAATRVVCHRGEAWFHVSRDVTGNERDGRGWFIVAGDGEAKPRPFAGNARLNDEMHVSEVAAIGDAFAAFAGYSPKRRSTVVAVYDRRAKTWSRILPAADGRQPGLLNRQVKAMLLEGDDTLWIAGRRKGVGRHDLRTGKRVLYNFGMPDCLANCVARYKTYLIVGLEGPPLGIVDLATGRAALLHPRDGIAGSYVHSLCVDGDVLWVGTHGNNGGLTKIALPALLAARFRRGPRHTP